MPPPEPHHLKARRSRRPDAETRRSFDCALTRVRLAGGARASGAVSNSRTNPGGILSHSRTNASCTASNLSLPDLALCGSDAAASWSHQFG
jgi:hypothetical protein